MYVNTKVPFRNQTCVCKTIENFEQNSPYLYILNRSYSGTGISLFLNLYF